MRCSLDQNQESQAETKWTKKLIDSGWTTIPNVIFERQSDLGITPIDMSIIINITGYWWKPNNLPFPTKESLAKSIGVSTRTIQRRITELEKNGLITRIKRVSAKGKYLSNAYSLSGLIEKATPLAEEKLALREIKKTKASHLS